MAFPSSGSLQDKWRAHAAVQHSCPPNSGACRARFNPPANLTPPVPQWGTAMLRELGEQPYSPESGPPGALFRERFANSWLRLTYFVLRRQVRNPSVRPTPTAAAAAATEGSWLCLTCRALHAQMASAVAATNAVTAAAAASPVIRATGMPAPRQRPLRIMPRLCCSSCLTSVRQCTTWHASRRCVCAKAAALVLAD